MSVRVYVCTGVCTYGCMYVRVYVCAGVCLYVCMYVRVYVRTGVCTYGCMSVRVYVCTCVCQYGCMAWNQPFVIIISRRSDYEQSFYLYFLLSISHIFDNLQALIVQLNYIAYVTRICWRYGNWCNETTSRKLLHHFTFLSSAMQDCHIIVIDVSANREHITVRRPLILGQMR